MGLRAVAHGGGAGGGGGGASWGGITGNIADQADLQAALAAIGSGGVDGGAAATVFSPANRNVNGGNANG